MNQFPISLNETLRARTVIRPYLKPTPLRRYESLCRLLGTNVWVKHENHNPTGTFKIRGGINLMHHLRAQGIGGVITYSTGNHGSRSPQTRSVLDMMVARCSGDKS